MTYPDGANHLWRIPSVCVLACSACGLTMQGTSPGAAPDGGSSSDARSDSSFGPGDAASRDGGSADAADAATSDITQPPEGGPDVSSDDGGGDAGGGSTDPGVVCGDASCPLGQTCDICSGSSGCGGCGSMPVFILSCDDFADCEGGACCQMPGGGPVVFACTDIAGCMGNPLCDPSAVDGGGCPTHTCKPADGPLMGVGYYNCH